MSRARWGIVAAVALGCVLPANASAGTLAFIADYCEGGPCAGSVWTVEDDGTGLRRLTAAEPTYPGIHGYTSIDAAPRWSSDGSRIAFMRLGSAHREDWGLWIMDADGSDSRLVLGGATAASDWSPSDDLIVFSTVREDGGGLPDVPSENPIHIRDSDVFTIRPDGTELTRVVNSPIEDGGPSFSADGRRIEFVRYLYGSFPDDRTGTYSVAVGGGDERRLSVGSRSRVSYSPDGSYAAYLWAGRLWVMNADGSNRRDRTPVGTEARGEFAWGTDQGADGPTLFFTAMRTDWKETGVFDVRVYRLDVASADRPAVSITPPGQGVGALDWTPGPGDPATTFVDLSPPAAFFLTGPRRSAGPAAATRVLNRKSLGLLGADASGIRRVRLAVARQVRRGDGVLCRFLGRTGLGAPRRCDRPRFIRGSSEQELLSPLRTLRDGRYLSGFTTVDVRGNATRKLRLRPLRLR